MDSGRLASLGPGMTNQTHCNLLALRAGMLTLRFDWRLAAARIAAEKFLAP
jgi:hypothetical protein